MIIASTSKDAKKEEFWKVLKRMKIEFMNVLIFFSVFTNFFLCVFFLFFFSLSSCLEFDTVCIISAFFYIYFDIISIVTFFFSLCIKPID